MIAARSNAGLLLIFLWASLSAAAQELEPLEFGFGQASITLVATSPACYRFDTYIASTFEQRRRGLMFVRDLPAMAGMLFIYDRDDILSMWMKNTFIPLDILFVRADGTIANIEKDTEPQSLKSISATEPVRYVLEVNAGVTDELGIDTDSYLVL